YAGRVILKEALNETEEVVSDYKQNVFTVLSASDNFVLPEKTQYFYKLEGFNEKEATSRFDMHSVTYTNEAPGTYIRKGKATNREGYAGTEEASLKIVILPPFWIWERQYIV
ncbi:triple tyrosine motif-containing protein, partial [Bacteroides thetaiotaomicron]|uniref:triple tyrosine motif-containing protein n=1 Tax=Bacteroides thetaiotaomicron TaxID=818 RepID=UPI000A6709F7